MPRAWYDLQYLQGSAGVGATANGNGNVLDAAGATLWAEVQELNGGTSTATLTFEGSNDGAQWYALGFYQVDGVASLARSASGISVVASAKHVYELDDAYPLVRARLSAVANGAAVMARAYFVGV